MDLRRAETLYQLRQVAALGLAEVAQATDHPFVGYLDCPFCCASKAVQVFDDGSCVCTSCPLGWHQHLLIDTLSVLKVELPDNELAVSRPVWDTEARAASLFAAHTYGSSPPPWGSRRGSRRTTLLG